MLYTATVEPHTLGLLKRLMAEPMFAEFNLVGGTALSLQIGHRKSIDLDLFGHHIFEAEEILNYLIDKGYAPSVIYSKQSTLIVTIQDVKVDFIRFRYPFAQAIQVIEGIRLADIQDIACMKIDAIAGRGKKKDFYDLYFLLQRYSLVEIMENYGKMFQHSTLFHVYKSLTWFEDANLEAEIDVLDKKITWEKVKKAVKKAVEKAI